MPPPSRSRPVARIGRDQSAQAGNAIASDVGNTTSSAADRTATATDRAADRTGHAISNGADRAADATSNLLEKVGKKLKD